MKFEFPPAPLPSRRTSVPEEEKMKSLHGVFSAAFVVALMGPFPARPAAAAANLKGQRRVDANRLLADWESKRDAARQTLRDMEGVRDEVEWDSAKVRLGRALDELRDAYSRARQQVQ